MPPCCEPESLGGALGCRSSSTAPALASTFLLSTHWPDMGCCLLLSPGALAQFLFWLPYAMSVCLRPRAHRPSSVTRVDNVP